MCCLCSLHLVSSQPHAGGVTQTVHTFVCSGPRAVSTGRCCRKGRCCSRAESGLVRAPLRHTLSLSVVTSRVPRAREHPRTHRHPHRLDSHSRKSRISVACMLPGAPRASADTHQPSSSQCALAHEVSTRRPVPRRLRRCSLQPVPRHVPNRMPVLSVHRRVIANHMHRGVHCLHHRCGLTPSPSSSPPPPPPGSPFPSHSCEVPSCARTRAPSPQGARAEAAWRPVRSERPGTPSASPTLARPLLWLLWRARVGRTASGMGGGEGGPCRSTPNPRAAGSRPVRWSPRGRPASHPACRSARAARWRRRRWRRHPRRTTARPPRR